MASAKNRTYNYNLTIRDGLARHNKIEGEVGIEIECEGSKLPGNGAIERFWTTHADGSLRGESIEYVLAGPVSRKDVIPSLEYLEGLFKDHKTKINDSYRTSVHVHLNMQRETVKQTYSTILMYGILEDILTEHAGVGRCGNLFCLRMSDAEFMLEALRDSAVRDNYQGLNVNAIRYAGCNVKSLFDHNSLEFRAFRGTADVKLISEWVDILLQIKDAGTSYESPAAMCADFSNLGPDGFLEKNFRKDTVKLLKGFKSYQERIVNGVRLIQDVAYANDWAATPEKISGESKKKSMDFAYYDQAVDIEFVPGEIRLHGINEMLRGQRPDGLAPQQVRAVAAPRNRRAGQPVFEQALADIQQWPDREQEDL